MEIATVIDYCGILTHFHGKANTRPARRLNKDRLVYQPIRGKHGLHPTMLSSSYLLSILDPQTPSCSCSLHLKLDTSLLTRVNGELKVCYSAVNPRWTSFKWIRSVSHFEKFQFWILWADFPPIKLGYKHWCSDCAAFKGEPVSDSALLPTPPPPQLLIGVDSPHLLLLIPQAAEPSHQILISSSRTEDKRSAAASFAAHSWMGL